MATRKGRSGVFVGLDPATLASLQTTALNWITTGQLESSTLNASQFKKNFMDPQDMLLEVQYAMNIALAQPIPNRVRAGFNKYRGGNGTGTDNGGCC